LPSSLDLGLNSLGIVKVFLLANALAEAANTLTLNITRDPPLNLWFTQRVQPLLINSNKVVLFPIAPLEVHGTNAITATRLVLPLVPGLADTAFRLVIAVLVHLLHHLHQ